MDEFMEDMEINGQSILVSPDQQTVLVYEPILEHPDTENVYQFCFISSHPPTRSIVHVKEWNHHVQQGYIRYEDDDLQLPSWFVQHDQRQHAFKYQLRF
jgi:hypothetical protein